MSTELASGYISLSVKYGDAMEQITKDLLGLDKTAKRAGDDAGKSLNKSLSKSMKVDSGDAKRGLSGITNAADDTGKKAGKRLGSGMLDGAKTQFKSGASKITGGLGSAGTDAAQNFLDGFGGPIGKIGSKAGPIGLALTAAVGLGFSAGALIAKQVFAGMEKEQQQANFAAKLGLTPEQAAPLAKGAGKAYANNFGESIADNMTTAEQAVQGGLLRATASAEESQRVIEGVNTVSQVTGADSQEIIRATGQLLRTGLVKDYDEAFDLIVKSQQKGLNKSEDLFDTINEYGTQWRKLGLDGEEAMGLINQAVQNGARDSDVAADAIKEFSIRAIDGSKTTTEAYEALGLNAEEMAQNFAKGGDDAKRSFGQVLDSLRKIEDPVKRNAIAVALFGTQAEDLGDALNHMDLDTATAEMEGLEGATQRAADTMGGTAAGSFESAKRTIEVAVGDMQKQLADVLAPTLQKFADWFVAHEDDVVNFFTKVGQGALWAVESVVRFVGDVIDAVADLVGAFGDVQGWVLKFQAWQADLRGDHETANEFRAQAEEAFGLGESLHKTAAEWKGYADGLAESREEMGKNQEQAQKVSEALKVLKNDLVTLPDGKTIVLKDNSEETKRRMEELGFAVERLPDGNLTIRVAYKDQNGNNIDPGQLGVSQRQQSAAQGNEGPRGAYASGGVVRGPGTGTSDSILAWLSNGEGVVTAKAMRNGGAALVAALNAGWTPPAEMLHGMIPGFAEGLSPGADFLRSTVLRMWPQITTIGGRRSEDGYGEHSSGNALDIMIPGYQGAEGVALGNSILAFLQKNASALGVDGIIWRQTSYGYGGSLTSGKQMSDRGSDTQNHMDHVHVILGKGRGVGAEPVQAPSVALSAPGSVSPSGNGSVKLREASDKVTDLESRVSVAEQELSEIESDPKAKESAKQKKRNEVEKLKRDLQQAKDDKATLEQELANGDGESGGGRNSGDDPFSKITDGLSDLADLAMGGIKETLLPEGFSDPTQWGILQAASGIFGFASGLVQDPGARAALGAVSAGLGGDAGGVVDALGTLIPRPFEAGTTTDVGPAPFEPLNLAPGSSAPTAVEPAAHQGNGQQPGPTTNINQNIVDPKNATDAIKATQTNGFRNNFGTARV